MNNWDPLPRRTERRRVWRGGRKTSPWTNFHPESSWTSSCISIWLYLAISLCRARKRTIATIPVRKMTMTAEFTRLNQWMRGSKTWRYLSHRVAHFVEEYYISKPRERRAYPPFNTVSVCDFSFRDFVYSNRSIWITIRVSLRINSNLFTRRLHNKPNNPILIPRNSLLINISDFQDKVHDTQQ